jgi:tRNA A-37 threonylcarbamoyl transferase component Bud32/tetratricopeptide (TPR) repeat protein
VDATPAGGDGGGREGDAMAPGDVPPWSDERRGRPRAPGGGPGAGVEGDSGLDGPADADSADDLPTPADFDDIDLDAAPTPAGGGLRLAEPPEEPGELRVGPYALRRLVGRGGMGSVYEAERVCDYAQRVAVKLMRPRLDEPGRRRFEAERQVLAGLDHPGIVRLLDGGTTRSGMPFLVMEFIEGERLDDYCRRERLGTDARVELVFHVACAVAHAHERGIVHRDLKPSNVLVTAAGVPKVTDFGLSRSVLGEGPATTTGEAIVGTPGYIAPEQMLRGPGRNRPGVDCYALGAMLFRLLAGRPPFEADTPLQACLQAAAGDPPPMRHPVRKIPRDLQTIVARALARDPAERFADAGELVEQLRRYLAREPLTIRPPTRRERLAKWALRHRVALLAWGVTLGAVLVAALAAVSASNRRLRADEQALRGVIDGVSGLARGLAEELPPGSRRLHRFYGDMAGVFETALDARGAAAEGVLRRRTAVMQHDAGRSSLARLELDDAIARFTRAIALLRPLADSEPNALRRRWTRFDLFRSLMSRSDAQNAAGRYGPALADGREALALIEAICAEDPENPDWLEAASNQHKNLGHLSGSGVLTPEEALGHADAALALARRAIALDPAAPRYLMNVHWAELLRGAVLNRAGDRAGRDRAYDASLAALEELLRRRPDSWEALSALVDVLTPVALAHAEREPAEGLDPLERALEASRRLMAAYPDTTSYRRRHLDLVLNLARVLHRAGNADAAAVRFREAIEGLAAHLEGHPEDVAARTQLAELYRSCPVVALRNPERARELEMAPPGAESRPEPGPAGDG